jgi:hypothetical protein
LANRLLQGKRWTARRRKQLLAFFSPKILAMEDIEGRAVIDVSAGDVSLAEHAPLHQFFLQPLDGNLPEWNAEPTCHGGGYSGRLTQMFHIGLHSTADQSVVFTRVCYG